MSVLVQILYGDEARECRIGAAFEFTDTMERFPERGALVSEAALDRWYADKGPGPDLGPPVSSRLERS